MPEPIPVDELTVNHVGSADFKEEQRYEPNDGADFPPELFDTGVGGFEARWTDYYECQVCGVTIEDDGDREANGDMVDHLREHYEGKPTTVSPETITYGDFEDYIRGSKYLDTGDVVVVTYDSKRSNSTIAVEARVSGSTDGKRPKNPNMDWTEDTIHLSDVRGIVDNKDRADIDLRTLTLDLDGVFSDSVHAFSQRTDGGESDLGEIRTIYLRDRVREWDTYPEVADEDDLDETVRASVDRTLVNGRLWA